MQFFGIEHVFGSLKTFKILAEGYRNREDTAIEAKD